MSERRASSEQGDGSRVQRQRRYLADRVPWWRSTRAALYRSGFNDGVAYAKQRLGGPYVDAPRKGRDY